MERGCRHYSNGSKPKKPLASQEAFSNENLAMALLTTAQRYDVRSIRCGAAMLDAPENDP